MSPKAGAGVHRERPVVIVGAGIGGLSCALSLASRGVPVVVVESDSQAGGKLRPLEVGGRLVDSGPTVFTMRWVFEQLFAQAGASFAERVPCVPLPVLARHAWRGDDATLDLLADRRAARDAVERFSGPQEARRFQAFCEEARRLYRHLEGPYIRSERPTLGSMVSDLGPGGLAALIGLGPFATLWRSLGRRFGDPRLRQLFARYATYCGASPWQAPATLMLIAQVELDGVWAVEGGMSRLAAGIEGVAREKGVVFRYDSRVQRVLSTAGRACGVALQGGEVIEASAVIFNGDVQALAGATVEGARSSVPATPSAQRSLSAMTWSLCAPTSGFNLTRHNVFFDADYRSEFDDIFGHSRFPRRPTVYLCAQDRVDGTTFGEAAGDIPHAAMQEAERMLVLVNAPATGDRGLETDDPHRREIDRCETATFDLLQACRLQIHRSRGHGIRTTPWHFERRFPATGGSLYGMATHGWMSAFRRNASTTAMPGLFMAGGSVHPGPGVPMATMSGRLAAEAVMAHLGSTSRSSRVVIAGGISMRSATTGSTA